MPAILRICDSGGECVSLIKGEGQYGFHLKRWRPTAAGFKGGGTWQDSPLADGRRPVDTKDENGLETFELVVIGADQDAAIRDMRTLRTLLRKATNYFTSAEDEFVYLMAQASCESNARYAVVYAGQVPEDGEPFQQPFLQADGSAVMDNLTLVVERGPWTACRPGTGACVQASGRQTHWEYGPWAINTAQPVGDVTEFLEASCGNLLATDWSGASPNIWRTNNGTVWNAAVTPPTSAPAALLEASDGYIYAACSASQVWRSGDCGVNWVQRNAAYGAQYHMALAELGNYLYLVMPHNNTIRRSNDGGATWSLVYTGPPTPGVICLADDGYLYVTGGGGTPISEIIWRSNDGTTWDQVFFNIPGATTISLYMIKQLDDGYIYAGGHRFFAGGPTYGTLFRSANGTDWGLIATVGSGQVSNMILASDGYYYLLLADGELYRGTDPRDWKLVVDIGAATTLGLIEYSVNSRIYAGETGDIWWGPAASTTVGRLATCGDEVFVANKQNVAQLTHVWEHDAAPVTWTNHFPSAAFPFNLLPNPMANGDAVVFSIDTSVFDSGPFSNIVLDLSRPATGDFILTWYYPSGGGAVFPPPGAGWTALNIHDSTAGLRLAGINSLHFMPPSNWATIAINGVTGYHIVGIISGVTGAPVGPQQGNRDVYTVNWPRADVSDDQVAGDVPALLRFKFHNRSDEDGYFAVDELDLLDNRVVAGLRSLDRGETFVAFLNCAAEQNPPGVAAAAGTGTSFGNETGTPTGRVATHTTQAGGLSAWDAAFTFALGPSIARDFYGIYHAYVRAQLYEPSSSPSGDHDDVRVRLRVRSGSGGVTVSTDHTQFNGRDAWDGVAGREETYKDWQLLDFGQVELPATGLLRSDELPDELAIDIEIASAAATNLRVDLYDLVLIPVDEWAGDFMDHAYEDDSCVENGYLLDVDSLAHPKRNIRSLVRTADASEFLRANWPPIGSSPAILQANADQRLWFLSARGVYQGEHDGGNGHAHLDDSFADFLDAGVRPGMTVYNVTDGSSATITAVTETRVDGALAGGVGNNWDNGDVYFIVCPNWRSEPWVCHTVQLWANARYLSMRGAG